MKANQYKIALSLMNQSTPGLELYIQASEARTQTLLFVPQRLRSPREQDASTFELTGQMLPIHGRRFHQHVQYCTKAR